MHCLPHDDVELEPNPGFHWKPGEIVQEGSDAGVLGRS